MSPHNNHTAFVRNDLKVQFWRDVWFLSNKNELDGTRLVWLKAPKTIYLKLQQQCLFPEIVTRLLWRMHRACCELFHVGTLFFLSNYTNQLYHRAEGSTAETFFISLPILLIILRCLRFISSRPQLGKKKTEMTLNTFVNTSYATVLECCRVLLQPNSPTKKLWNTVLHCRLQKRWRGRTHPKKPQPLNRE